MGVILSSGGQWYLGVGDEDAAAAAGACYVAAAIYGGYVLCCGYRMTKLSAGAPKQLDDEPDV